MYLMQAKDTQKKLFGLVSKTKTPTRLIDNDGVIRLQKQNGFVKSCTAANWKETLLSLIGAHTVYDDGGKTLPNAYLIYNRKILDLCNLGDEEHVVALAGVELRFAEPSETVMFLCSARLD